jgi:hypothetical protein
MKLPSWLIISVHLARGFAIGFGGVIGGATVVGNSYPCTVWIAATIAGVIGVGNAMDTLKTDADSGRMTSIQIKRPEVTP